MNNESKTFGAEADAFLRELYDSVGAESASEKINVLRMKLDGTSNFYAFGGEINEDMKLACLEYEYLDKNNKIQLDLA